MANQTGRPIAPARKLIAAVLGTIAVFVVLFGVGLASWAIAVLGLVMLAFAIVLALVNVARRGARAWVAGTAQVKAVSDPPVSSRYGRAELQLVVVAPGLPVTEVLAREPRVPVEKWPRPGDTVPVQVDVDDMRRVRIDWATAPDNVELPQPGHSYDAAYPDPQEEFDDDLLGDPEPPPWATGSRDRGPGSDEPPLPGPVIDHGPMAHPSNTPVIVHDTPVGAVVEGYLVDQPKPDPLPRRARSGPIPSPSPPADPPAEPEAMAQRPPGSRPSPHPRRPTSEAAGRAAATATVDREESGSTHSGSTEAAAGPTTSPAPPSQRIHAESTAADSAPADSAAAGVRSAPVAEPAADSEFGPAGGRSIDIPLDDFVRPAAAHHGAEPTAGAYAVTPETAPHAGPGPDAAPAEEYPTAGAYAVSPDTAPHAGPPPDTAPAQQYPTASAYAVSPDTAPHAGPAPDTAPAQQYPTAGAYAVSPDTAPNAEPRPAASAPVTPEPVAPEPVAPDPVAPPPTAPEPIAGTVGDASGPATGPHDPDIDIALDGDPEPPPEFGPDAKPSVAAGIVAPPAEPTGTAGAGMGPAGVGTAGASTAGASTAGASTAGASTAGAAAAARAVAAGAAAAAAARHSPGSEVPADERPVISGLDQPPAGDDPRRHWADLEGGYNPDERTNDVITAYPSARPGPSGAIHGVGVLILVTNLNRSVAFYQDVLGFFVIDGGPGSAVLASGDTRVVLRVVYEVVPDTPRVVYLNLEVGDIDGMYEELRSKGVEFVHGPRLVNQGERLELWSATFMDPDRHNIAISQWKAAR